MPFHINQIDLPNKLGDHNGQRTLALPVSFFVEKRNRPAVECTAFPNLC
jgi:hypothetical protein